MFRDSKIVPLELPPFIILQLLHKFISVDQYDIAIEIAKWDTALRERRAEAYLKIGRFK